MECGYFQIFVNKDCDSCGLLIFVSRCKGVHIGGAGKAARVCM